MRLSAWMPIAAVACLAAGCDDNNAPTAPTDSVIFTAQLSAANEVPAISNDERDARGTATVALDLTRDAGGNVSGSTATFSISLFNFPAGSSAILAHIHEGAAGVAGGVRVNTGLSNAAPVAMPNGAGFITASGISVNADITNRILANPGGFYVNVHTPRNQGGAVRGQLNRQ